VAIAVVMVLVLLEDVERVVISVEAAHCLGRTVTSSNTMQPQPVLIDLNSSLT